MRILLVTSAESMDAPNTVTNIAASAAVDVAAFSTTDTATASTAYAANAANAAGGAPPELPRCLNLCGSAQSRLSHL